MDCIWECWSNCGDFPESAISLKPHVSLLCPSCICCHPSNSSDVLLWMWPAPEVHFFWETFLSTHSVDLFTSVVVSSGSMIPMSPSFQSVGKETFCYVTVVISNIRTDWREGSSEKKRKRPLKKTSLLMFANSAQNKKRHSNMQDTRKLLSTNTSFESVQNLSHYPALFPNSHPHKTKV